jgi:hypothetical protein
LEEETQTQRKPGRASADRKEMGPPSRQHKEPDSGAARMGEGRDSSRSVPKGVQPEICRISELQA